MVVLQGYLAHKKPPSQVYGCKPDMSVLYDDDTRGQEGWTAGVNPEPFIVNLLVRIHFIIVMIRWTGLAPWEFSR